MDWTARQRWLGVAAGLEPATSSPYISPHSIGVDGVVRTYSEKAGALSSCATPLSRGVRRRRHTFSVPIMQAARPSCQAKGLPATLWFFHLIVVKLWNMYRQETGRLNGFSLHFSVEVPKVHVGKVVGRRHSCSSRGVQSRQQRELPAAARSVKLFLVAVHAGACRGCSVPRKRHAPIFEGLSVPLDKITC